MYTATVQSKTVEANGVIAVNVIFTDGTNNIPETVRPSDMDGFKYWVKSRLTALNAVPVLQTTLADGATVDVSDPVVVPPTLTQAQIDLNTWLGDYAKWIKIKTTLIDTGILTGSEAPVVALKTKVQTNFKASYLNSI